MTGLNDISGVTLDEQADMSAGKDIVDQYGAKKELKDITEIVQDEYIREVLDGDREGLANQGELGKERDQALIEDLIRFSEVGQDADNLSYMFRRDAFEFSDGTNMNSEQIEEALVSWIMSAIEGTRAEAQVVYNTYMDQSESLTQTITPQSDTGSNTSSNNSIVMPDLTYVN